MPGMGKPDACFMVDLIAMFVLVITNRVSLCRLESSEVPQ